MTVTRQFSTEEMANLRELVNNMPHQVREENAAACEMLEKLVKEEENHQDERKRTRQARIQLDNSWDEFYDPV